MNAVFEKILQMSAVASIVIIAVLLVRLLLSKAPKKYSYFLWSVVAFRLICPVSFRSAFSLLRIVKRPESVVSTVPHTPTTPAAPVIPIEPTMPDIVPPTNVPADTITAAGTDWSAVLAVIWCIGIAAMLVYAVISWFKVNRRLNNAVLLSENLWQSDKVRSPLIVGVLRPKIYIPFDLEEGALRYALAHERCHLSRFDHVVRPLAYLILTVHWFNPLCWIAYFLMVKDMEMSCDEAVLKNDPDGQKAYSYILVSFAANKRFPTPNPLAFGETGVKKRIKNILNWKKPRAWVTIAAVVLCVAVLAACAADPTVKVPESEPGLKLGSGDSWVLANWYADGFDFDYDELNTLTVERNTELRFEPDFPAENLSIGEDLYIKSGDATHIQQRTITLSPDENGEYRHSLQVSESAEKAVYFIPYEEGKFVIKVLFAEAEETPDEPAIGYTYSLPHYYGTTSLDEKIWEHMQMPESGGLQRYQVPTLVCSERSVAKLWQLGILDDNEYSDLYGIHITDTAGLFIAMNIRGWETIYEGVIDRYIDEIGPALFTDEVTYDITLSMEHLILQFISGTDVCGYKFIDDETGQPIETGVARIPKGTAEAILEFISPGMAGADYVEPPYTLGFTDKEIAYYSGPGGGVMINTVAANSLAGVAKAAEVDGELWLRIIDYDFKLPGYMYGWLPAAELREYTEELSESVVSPILVPEGTEYYSCSAFDEIANTETETARYDRYGVLYAREDGYCLLGLRGGEDVWVKEEYIRPYTKLFKNG